MAERWTLHHVSGHRDQRAMVDGPSIWRGAGDAPVVVVRAPDEAAIERGAKALFGEVYPDGNFNGDWRADECREQALVVLRAALGDGDGS